MECARSNSTSATGCNWRGPAVATTILFGLLAAAAAGRQTAEPSAESAPFLFASARMLAAEQGRTEEALELFERAVEADPEAPFLRIGFAEFLSRLRRVEEAAGHAAVAYEMAPDDVDVLRSYGRIQMALASGAGGRDRAAVDRAVEALEKLRRVAPSDIEGMLMLYRIRRALDDADEAAAVIEELVSYHNGNRQLQHMLVDALKFAGQTERAQEVLNDMLRFEERSVDARLELANIESERGDHTKAIELLEGVTAELSENVRIRGALAEAYFRRGLSRRRTPEQRADDLAEALRRVRALPRDARRSREARRLEANILAESGDRQEAVDLLDGLWRERPGDLQTLGDLLGRLEEGGDWERIRDIGQSLVDRADRNREAGAKAADFGVEILVRALRELGEFDRALALLQTEEERRGSSVELVLSQAELLVESGKKRRALAMLRREVVAAERLKQGGQDGDPDFGAIDKKARLYFRLGADRLALEVLEEVAASGIVSHLLMIADSCRLQGRFAESVPFLERAVAGVDGGAEIGAEIAPEILRPSLLFQLGEAYERTRRYDEAAEQFRAVLELQPENGQAMNYLGYMWADIGKNLEQALELVRRAVDLDPTNGAFVDSLGWALFRLGDLEEARLHLERANQLVPEDSTILEHLGDVYVALGDSGRAREAYEDALAIDDDENVEAVRRKLSELSRQ